LNATWYKIVSTELTDQEIRLIEACLQDISRKVKYGDQLQLNAEFHSKYGNVTALEAAQNAKRISPQYGFSNVHYDLMQLVKKYSR
jgi:DNA-binding GntR family transcriptional regulator